MIFSGSSNKPLTAKLAKLLQAKLGRVQLTRFENREVRVFVKEKNLKEAIVVQSLSNPPDEHLVEFNLICDALKRLGVAKITGVIPWLGYSKQDKVFRPGEPLSVKVIADMLQVSALDRVITVDLHNPSILGFFDAPVTNLSARELFIKHFKKLADLNVVVVAPDAGAVKNSTAFAQELGVGVAFIDKKRDLGTGEVKIRGITGEVGGKQALLIDDMIVTGSTLVETAEFLRKKGVKKILVGATHCLYLPGVLEAMEKNVDQLVITDTIEKPKKIKFSKTSVLSVAQLVARSLK